MPFWQGRRLSWQARTWLRPWLPALAGVVIGSPQQTEAFLYDWRETLAEMLAEYHYGTVAEVARENGLIVYGEALENGRPMLGDDLAMRITAGEGGCGERRHATHDCLQTACPATLGCVA